MRAHDSWVSAVAIVNFDLELGQSIEHLEPPDFPLTETEKLNICYLAFPDSNSGCSGDTSYHFRIRKECSQGKQVSGCAARAERDPSSHSRDTQHYYGYVFFRQLKGEQFKRGYFQKSLVLITRRPLVHLYSTILHILAPQFFDVGRVALEVAMHNFGSWEEFSPGKNYQVPLFGQVLSFHVPSLKEKTQPTKQEFPRHALAPKPVILRSIIESELYRTLQPLLPHLGIIWELVLLNEPIVVFGASPTVTSATVHALINLIAPLRYAADYRPFFTIHDTEFKELTSRAQAPSRVILGVTNPYFNKALQHWPHVVILESGEERAKPLKLLNPKEQQSSSLRGKPGLYTRYKPLLPRDRLHKKLLGKGERPEEVLDLMVRRHLTDMTHSLVIPLEQWVSGLMPLQKSICPFRQPPLLQPFQPESFLATAKMGGEPLRSCWKDLYRRFMRSPNFELWFQTKRNEANQRLEILHIQELCDADLYTWMTGKHEVQIVDLLLWIRDRFDVLERLGGYPGLKDNLKSHIETLLNIVPTDLQSTLKPAFQF